MKLIIEDDEGRKTVVPIVREDVEITIGRQEGNTIRLTERNVSRKHAKLTRKLSVVSIEDLGSYNGIKVNGDRIQGALQLKEGDLVQIGDYDLAIQSEEPKAAAPQQTLPPAGAEAEPGLLQTEATEAPEADTILSHAGPTQPSVPVAVASKKHDATSVISGAQLKSARPARKISDIPAEEAPRLLLMTTELAGREYACIRSELKIGRTDDNDIAIDHRSISRNHCKVVREDNGEWRVIDLQSANGVQINGETYSESALKAGDVLELGHLRFKFLAPGEEAPSVGEANEGRRSNLGLFLGIGIVVVLAGGLGTWYVIHKRSAGPEIVKVDVPEKPKPDKPPPVDIKQPEPNKPDPDHIKPPDKPPELGVVEPKPDDPELLKAQKAFDAGKKRLAAGEFKKAAKALDFAEQMGIAGAKELAAKARAESEAEDLLLDAQKRFKAGELSAARQALEAISADTSFAPKAKTLLAQIAAAEEARTKKDSGQTRKVQAEEFYKQGLELYQARKAPQAANYFRQALQADPTHARAHMYLGTCLAAAGDTDEGARHYEEFVHLAPDDPNAAAAIKLLRDFVKSKPSFKLRYPLPP